MKLLKILLGIFFGVGAVLGLIGGLNDEWANMNLSTPGLTAIAALVAAVGMLTLFSVWSFQSAFRRPIAADKKRAVEDNTRDSQPSSPSSTKQPG